MKSKLTLAVIATALAATVTPVLLAQGKGNGLNRGLGGTGNSASSRAVGGRSSDAVARASGNLARGGMGLNKANPGLSRMGALPNGRVAGSAPVEGGQPVAPTQAATNPQRILDHRMQQAEHLRGISQRNGNERLLETADRMDASAIRNFERQSGTVYQPPVPPVEDGTTAPAPVPVTETAIQPQKTNRGFWLRSR